MSAINAGIKVAKPISIWSRNVNVEPKSFFTNLVKATCNGAKGNFDGCLENIIDSVVEVKAEEKLGQLAWILIYHSMQESIIGLLKESYDLLTKCSSVSEKKIEDELEKEIAKLAEKELILSSDFLDFPSNIEIIDDFVKLLEKFCLLFGASPIDAKSIASKLPSKFNLSLYSNWYESNDKFEELIKVLDSKISKASNSIRKWELYHQLLHVGAERRVFKESFGLKDIYVPPRAYFKTEIKKSQTGSAKNKVVNNIVCLHSFLKKWVLDNNYLDNLRFVSGGPGAGKSSFSRIFASEVAKTTGINVILIQLHLLDMSKDLTSAINDYCSEYRALQGLDVFASQQLLILFDGLDEISMQGKIGDQVSTNFINELKRKSEFLIQDKRNVKIIVTGRDLSIQSSESIVKDEKKYFHLIPYYVTKTSFENSLENQDLDELLLKDQREEWWKKFCFLKGLEFKTMPKSLKINELNPISSQPLLGYLLALSFLRGQIDFQKKPNLNIIYQDLLESIYERQYASDNGDHSQTHKAIGNLSNSDFDILMQEIALAVWHNDGTKATEGNIFNHLKSNELEYLLEPYKTSLSNGVASLLLSFYFRKHSQTEKGESTFEFTHKSFGEYLVAKKLVNLIIDLSDAYDEKRLNPRKGKKLEDIVLEWITASGKSQFDFELYKFVLYEFENLNLDELQTNKVLKCLKEMINYSIEHNLPIERFHDLQFSQMLSYAENSNLGLMGIHSAFTRNLERSDFDHLFSTNGVMKAVEMERWLDRNLITPMFCEFLNHINFSGISLYFKSFIASGLNSCNFSHSDITRSFFSDSLMFETELSSVYISHSDFEQVDFHKSNWINSSVECCEFSKTSFVFSVIKDCLFVDVKFENASFNCASLNNVTFNDSNCKFITFEGADLTNVIFRDSSLIGADFDNANLKGVNFSNQNLEDSGFRNTVIESTKFTGANLNRADFSGADLSKIDLTGVDLSGAILTDAILPKELK